MATIQDKYTSCPRTLPPPTALVLLATGTEELELVTIVDVLRRGNVEVTISGMDTTEVTKCRCDTKIVPDTALCQAICNAPYGVIVLPGGLEAAKTFLESKILCSMLKDQEASKGLIAGICAAPMVFKAHGICKGYHITCYPALAAELCIGNEYKYHDKRPVVVDRNLITSRGPATSMNFAFTILGLLKGDIIAQEVANAMLFDYCSSKALQNINE